MSRQFEILNTPTQELPFSPELKSLLLEQELKSLQDLLNVPAYRWHDYPSFTYHHQYEIINYLQVHDLMVFLNDE